jgi:methionyl-tRNA formyltransferase
MRIGWIGSHLEGIAALRGVLERGVPLESVITLTPEEAARRSGAVDYAPLCAEYGVPLYRIANINDDRSLRLLEELSLDLVFVIGWSQVIRSEALKLVKIGMIGAHASLLPHNRGRAPVNWSLIKGETSTGNSLIWLTEVVDAGDIIDQIVIPVTRYDTCASLYQKVAATNEEMILRVLPKIFAGERPGIRQPHNGTSALPGRKPQDGILDWSLSSKEVYDFVRALTRPYPGAFSWLDGKRWLIWHCSLLPDVGSVNAVPGQVIGSIYSPIESACGQVVACGYGAVALLELEDNEGLNLKGRKLSDQSWKGKIWTNG